MLKIIQARFQQYMNQELPDVQAGFKKGRETRDQIANICWIIEKLKNSFLAFWLRSSVEKPREFPKTVYFCFIDYVKAFDHEDHNKLESS